MRRGGTSRAWAAAWAAPLTAALLAALTVTGCDTTGSGRAGRDPSADADGGRTASPSPRVTSDEDLCAELVGHWSRQVLDGDTYGDYQSMGLSGGQYDILREVVDSARAARRQGTPDVGRLIDREAREGCAEWYRAGGPGEGPWQ
ncbi:hypothetical protein BU52_24135 [Streptomyces toyocaensis]|uniref:Lipoprotein n=1 Tax=Streptomyces toyocaensis TaxID=55952 RepID=A0A081XME1_STRTO|nr:hypothetical protein [Streptomyces toyocaensis]KES04714.1 hypothetical protein BU52_24135 [Streptomyces toyocaensis]